MFKAIYLTGTIVAFCFALLWLDVDEMREEMQEEGTGLLPGEATRKEKAALVWAQVGTTLTVGLMWWLVVVASIGCNIDDYRRRLRRMNITESEDQAQRLIFDWARWQQGKYPARLCTMQRMKGSEAQELGQN